MKNWYSECLRKVHWDFDNPPDVPDIGKNFDSDKFISTLKKAEVNAICFFAKDCFGHAYYNSRVSIKHPNLKCDLFKEATDACHTAGIKVLAYYTAGVDEHAAETHPDWCQKTRSLKSMLFSAFTRLCVNTPYVDEILLPQVNEIAKEYKIDGFFFDHTVIFIDKPCFCKYCREKFGNDIPKDKNDSIWPEYTNWRRKALHIFEKKVADSIHRIDPAILMGSNYSHTVRNPEPPPQWLDYLVIDVNENEKESEALGISLDGRYLATLGKPFDIMNTRFLHWWGDWMLKPIPSLKQECATVLANGGGCFIGDKIYPDCTLEGKVFEAIGETYEFVKEREKYCKGAKPVPYIAILHSASTYYKKEDGFPSFDPSPAALNPIRGAHKALLESSFHFNIINEDTLLKNLSEYKTLILPNQDFLSKEVLQEIKKFVAEGGRLVLSGNIQNSGLLNDVLGIRYKGLYSYAYGYIKTLGKSISKGIDDFPLLIPEKFVLVELKGAKPLAMIIDPLTSFETSKDSFAFGYAPPGCNSGCPAITLNKYGKGEAVYIAADIFDSYWKKNQVHLKYLVANLLDLLIEDKLLSVDAPPSVEVSLMKQGERLLLHLVNWHVEKSMNACYVSEHIPYLTNIKAKLSMNKKPGRIVQLPEGKDLRYDFKSGVLSFNIPKLEIYSIIAIE